MDQFNLSENVDTLFHSLESFTQKEGVIGKAVSQNDKTFLPIVSVTVGYGGGNASMGGKGAQPGGANGSTGSGTGALGLGAKLSTEAIILIDKENVSVMPMNVSGASQIMDKIPQILSGMNKGGHPGQTGQSGQPESGQSGYGQSGWGPSSQ